METTSSEQPPDDTQAPAEPPRADESSSGEPVTIEREVEGAEPASFVDRIAELEGRLAAQEKRLIEQEHRPLAIIRDLWDGVSTPEKRWPAISAGFRRFFLATPAVTLGASAVAIAGVYLAFQANEKLDVQNELLESQNEFFRQQIQQQAVQDYRARRAQLIASLYDTRDCRPGEHPTQGRPTCPSSSVEARAAAAMSLVQIEAEVRRDPERWPGVSVGPTTSLHRVDLRDAVIREAKLERVNLSGADLRGADLHRANLHQANLHQADLSRAILEYAILRKSDLGDTDLREAQLYLADLSGSYISGANFSEAGLIWAKLRGANLRNAKFNRAYLQHADLTNADLTNADLTNADLTDADLTNADLTNADLSDADLTGAILTDANLTDTIVEGTTGLRGD